MRASLDISLRRCEDGTTSAHGTLTSPPMWCRWDGDTLWLVGSAASPVGRDEVRIHLDVGPMVHATVRTVAATIVYAGDGDGTSTTTSLRVAAGASLRWVPEPVIVTGRARHRSHTLLRVDGDGDATIDEVVVLGRDGESSGKFRSTVEVSLDGVSTLVTSFDTSIPGWAGPGGVDGAAVTATRLRCGSQTAPLGAVAPGRGVVLSPDGGGALAVVVADDARDARSDLDALLPPSVKSRC